MRQESSLDTSLPFILLPTTITTLPLPKPFGNCSGRHGSCTECGRRREVPASQGATAPLVVATQAVVRRSGAHSGLAPQLWCEATRVAPSPTETGDRY